MNFSLIGTLFIDYIWVFFAHPVKNSITIAQQNQNGFNCQKKITLQYSLDPSHLETLQLSDMHQSVTDASVIK